MAETKATRKELFERIINVMADDPEVVEMERKVERNAKRKIRHYNRGI